MKILFYPEPDGANDYTSNMVKNLTAVAGEAIHFSPNIKDIVLRPHKTFCYKKYDVAVINWLENNIRNSGNRLFVFGIVKFFIYTLFFKLAAKKTVYVRHNLYPHDMPANDARRAKKIVDFAERLFDKKVAHSGHLTTAGYDYIPHPLYQTNTVQQMTSATDGEPYYLIFGRVERYKQIHTLLTHWPATTKLIIAGPASDEGYINQLIQQAQGMNVVFDIRFVPNEVVDTLMSNAKAVILSHGGDEMIVSGSFFHTISYGVPVLASNQPFLRWLKQDIGFSGLTLFNSMDELTSLTSNAETVTRAQILSESDALFGEPVVQAQMQRLLNGLDTVST